MMDFYVFDLQFNFHGIIDDYVNIPITRNYEKKSSFTIEVTPTEKNLQLLKKNRLIAKQTDIEHAYIIETIEYIDGKDSSLTATVFSLHHLLSKRVIADQQAFYGRVGHVLSEFVNVNAVNPINPKRIIPNLVIDSSNSSIGPTTSEARTTGQLDEVLFEIAIKFGVSWDILFDYDNKQFIFKVWQGADRSEQQDINPHVVFAKEFDNVISQNYVNSDNGFKNVAIVAGEGEGAERKRIVVNDGLSGFERNELFVDARDLQSTYYDENNQEVTIPEVEYLNILIERGKSKLAENEPIETLDNEIDIESSFKYEEDYFLGDIVSVKNSKLGLIAHPRIIQIVETFSKEGRTLHADFGKSVPTRDERLQKKIEESIIIGGNTGSKNIEWNNVKDKPSTFPPSSHHHDDRYYTESEINNLLRNKLTDYKGSSLRIGEIDAINNSEYRWNKPENTNVLLANSNNAMVFTVDGAINGRKALIQVGHHSPGYAQYLGQLHLNPLGGDVFVNGHKILHTLTGIGSPEGVVSAPIGSFYINTNGGANTTLYIKTSGNGNTGWTAK